MNNGRLIVLLLFLIFAMVAILVTNGNTSPEEIYRFLKETWNIKWLFKP